MRKIASPARRARGFLSALLRCREGASAVEFAIIFPIFLLLIIGMLEVAWTLYIQSAMEGALRQSARYGITGQGGSGATRDQQILDELNRYTFGSINILPAMLTKKVYASFQDVGLPEPFTDTATGPNHNGEYDLGETFTDINGNAQYDEDRGIVGAGNTGQVVRYQFDYTLLPLTGFVEAFVGGIHLQAVTVVRNEPY